jgi:NAD+ synthase (glutamine-hydrolysing)
MKVGIAQINTIVGDLAGNRALILQSYKELVAEGADLVLYPELTVCGYPPRDLLFKSRFVADTKATLQSIAEEIREVPAIIGYVEDRDPRSVGRPFYNAAAWCESGSIKIVARKSLLPSYDVFDEERYFEPAEAPTIHEWKGKRIGITICEDIWNNPEVPTSRRYCEDPLAVMAKKQLDLLVNLSASPWHEGKNEAREPLVRDAAERCGCPAVYCNAVGGNDELIFDGGSIVAHHERGLIAGLAAFGRIST